MLALGLRCELTGLGVLGDAGPVSLRVWGFGKCRIRLNE